MYCLITKVNICSKAQDGPLYTGINLFNISKPTNILHLYLTPYTLNTSGYPKSFQLFRRKNKP